MADETLDLIRAARTAPLNLDVLRQFSQSTSATTGLTYYDLEAPSKKLFPVLTPLRNKIARVTGGKGIQSNWKAVTGINTSFMDPGVSAGNRGGRIEHTTADYFAKFAGLGLEDAVDFEADWAAEGFEDVKALAVQNLLRALMIQEEFVDLGGNGTVPLGQVGTITTADVASGGTLPQSTSYTIGCVGLTLQAYLKLVGANNGAAGQTFNPATAAVQQTITRANADGTSDTYGGGVSQPATGVVQATASGNDGKHSITASVPTLNGAVAYAWYWGLDSTHMYLGAVTTVNTVTITKAAVSTAQLYSALANTDNSTNALVYDGMLTQIQKAGSGSIVADNGAGKLTSDAAGGITQINADLQSFWDQYRISPSEIYVSGSTLMDITTLVVANGGSPLVRFNFDAQAAKPQITAGVTVGTYLNKITGTLVNIVVHPNMPAGMVFYWSDSVPYPDNNLGRLVMKHCRRDYYQIEWPQTSRKYQYGCYFDGVLKASFMPAFGIRKNILPGV